MKEGRGPWYLITGFILGIGIGLAYAWIISPVEYQGTTPSSLRADFKDRYRAMIALAFVANGDLTRAKARLNLLEDEDTIRTLTEQAQRTLAEGETPQEAQALGLLAVALGEGLASAEANIPSALPSVSPKDTEASPMPLSLPTILSSSQWTATPTQRVNVTKSPIPSQQTSATSSTPLLTGTPLPTRTPTATPGAPFVLHNRTFICDKNISEPLTQIVAKDINGQQVSGIEIVVTWSGGEEHFFTGLKPELGIGYADYGMTPGVIYALRLMDGGQTITDLTAAECEDRDGSRYWGSWLLEFVQP